MLGQGQEAQQRQAEACLESLPLPPQQSSGPDKLEALGTQMHL